MRLLFVRRSQWRLRLAKFTQHRAPANTDARASQAQRIEIRGPEFSVTLPTRRASPLLCPPTRMSSRQATKHWRQQSEVTVFADQSAVTIYAPKLGALRLEVSHPDVGYRLEGSDRGLIEAGKLPATVDEYLKENTGWSPREELTDRRRRLKSKPV